MAYALVEDGIVIRSTSGTNYVTVELWQESLWTSKGEAA
jgi:hypothetical protein